MILALFSVATYLRYRTAAWRAFDTDLLNNLGTLQSAFLVQIGEQRSDTRPQERPRISTNSSSGEVLRKAAVEALDEFRLNGLYAEIRLGDGGETRLALLPGAGVAPVGGLLDESLWRESARTLGTRVVSVEAGRRAAIRSLAAAPDHGTISLAVGDRTVLVEQTLVSIRRSLFEFGTAGLLLALAGGYWLARRTLRPIDTLTTEAGRMAAMAPSAGSHRLKVPDADDELGRLASTFNRLLERIESSVTQMKDFIADAAHELKTPVSIVRTEAELSLSSNRSLEDYREALHAIAGESAHLSRLVSDLTLLAEGEMLEHPVERRLVDLNELIHEVARSVRSLAASRGIVLNIDSTGYVEYRGDERLLRQIFTNLIENAIKFSRARAQIGIVLSEEPGIRELRVLDEAPTLSPSDRQRVFERFYRSQRARSTDANGTGLGLAIVEWAVKLHGGTVRVEPREPIGNIFAVSFPVAIESKEPVRGVFGVTGSGL